MGDSDPDDLQQELLDTGEQKGNPMTTMYDLAREEYAALGIDTEAVMEKLAAKPISVHCWQGDDVLGFDQEGGLSGGIQTTGNYPGRARTFEELTCDFEAAMALVPGAKRINLHASYAVFTDENPWVDRDAIEYKHFEPWVAWAKAHGYGIDFNPTIFGHPMMSNELSLSSPDAATRDFWIRHCKACRKISQQIGEALDDQTLCNIWIPDGLKDVPGDRFGLRERLRDSLDEIYAEKYDRVIDSCESKVFGIGLESMTVGSNEFYLAYAATHPGVYDLLDLGHFHPTENVADKLSALLLFFDKVPLHVTRPVRWDSDHVVLFDDPTKEVAMEIAHIPGAWEKVIIGLDFFDASINRVGAWATGTRAMEKSLLYALLQPGERLKELQDTYQFTEKMMLAEQAKSMPFGAVWDEYCRRAGCPLDGELYPAVAAYEAKACPSACSSTKVSPPRSFKQGATIWHFSIRHRRCFPRASTRRAGRCPAWPWSSWDSCAGSCACATTAGSRAGTSATAATSAIVCVPRMWTPLASSSTRSRALGRPSALRCRPWVVHTSSSPAPATTCAMWRPIPLATSALWSCPRLAMPTASCGVSTTGGAPRPSSRPTS